MDFPATLIAILLTFFAVACGDDAKTTTLTTNSSTDSGEQDAQQGDANQDAGQECIDNPTLDGGCEQGQTACRTDGCSDKCAHCEVISCLVGKWQKITASPAPCFICGDEQCVKNDEYCLTTIPGVQGAEIVRQCEMIPAACTEEKTCSCLEQLSPGSSCTDESGEFRVDIALP